MSCTAKSPLMRTLQEVLRCPLCRATQLRTIVAAGAKSINQCLRCSVCFLFPQPSRAEVTKYFQSNEEEAPAANLKRDYEIRKETEPKWHHDQKNHGRAMHREELIVHRRTEERVVRLGQLRAHNNWHRIAREWMYDAEPVTELGRAEAEFYGHSGVGAPG